VGEVPNEGQLRAFLLDPGATWCGASTRGHKVFRWQRTFPEEELDLLVNAQHAVGHVTAIEVVDRGVSGRVRNVRFVGARGRVVVSGELRVRQLLGNLRSGMFVVDRTGAEWTFTGGGWGHGVGMCQQGAIGMGEAGRSAGQILHHYFKRSAVQRVY
jgi:SpoIID/LytB domain protein